MADQYTKIIDALNELLDSRFDKIKTYIKNYIANYVFDSEQLKAGSIISTKYLDGSILPIKINIPMLFADEATITALKTSTIGSVEAGTSVLIDQTHFSIVFDDSTGEFSVTIKGTEEGEFTTVIDKNGVSAPAVYAKNVAGRVPWSGVRTVGTGGDYSTLDEVFDEIESKALSGDITLKLLGDDPGGILRGVSGGHSISITSGDILDQSAAFVHLASLTVQNTNDYKVTATSADAWSYLAVQISRVGYLSLAGKQITVSLGDVTNGGGTSQQVCLFSYNPTTQALSQIGSEVTANTSRVYTIPSDISDDYDLILILYASSGTACAVGAYTTYCNLRVELGDTMAANRAASKTISSLNIANNSARINIARIISPSNMVIRSSGVALSESEIYGAVGVLADMAQVRMHNNTGSCTQAVKSICSQVQVTGTAPGGTYGGWLIDTTSASIGSSGTAPTTTTITLTANSTGTYGPSSWWTIDRSVRQGYTTSNRSLRGGIWFNFSSIPSGATITALRLTLKRTYGYGISAGVNIRAYGTSSNARDGQPALTSGPYDLGTAATWGNTKTHDLPAGLVTAIANSSCKGIVLNVADSSVISGKDYSENYARFDGTDGTAPKLIVTYTV